MLKQAHLFVKGDVVGVGFRAWTKIQAKIIGVSGWVRNVYDRVDIFGSLGGVEIVVQGDESALSLMIEKINQGSPVSMVEHVEVMWETPKEIFEDFKISR